MLPTTPDLQFGDLRWGPPDAAGCRYAAAMISTTHPAYPHWNKPVVVTIRNRNGLVDVVGIDRPTELPQ